MKIFLVRHGETLTSGRSYAGRTDVPLTARGREQARLLAERLAPEQLTFLLASPLSRAVETARPLASRTGLGTVEMPALMEIDFGAWEGRDKADLGPVLRKTHAHDPIPGGESLHDVWCRAGQVIAGLPWATGSAGAIVGHYWINRLLWGRLTGLTFEEACRSRTYRPRTGSCVTLDLPEGARSAAILPEDLSP